MSEVAEKTAEVVAENVEDAVDGIVEVVEVVRNNPTAMIACLVAGLGLGAVGGYFAARKYLESEFEERLEQEIENTKNFFERDLNKIGPDGSIMTPMDVLRDANPEAADALTSYRGQGGAETPYEHAQDEAQIAKIQDKLAEKDITLETDSVEIVEESDGTMRTTKVQETVNVFTEDTFDLEVEKEFRTPIRPYIITKEEFFESERDFENKSLTYFSEDDTLVDSKSEPIREVDATIGDDHLVRFGSGSGDRNRVYIRNERLKTDFEVVKSTGSYAREVLGLPDDSDELRHSDQHDRRRNFRRGEG